MIQKIKNTIWDKIKKIFYFIKKYIIWIVVIYSIILLITLWSHDNNLFSDNNTTRGIKIMEKSDFKDGFTKVYPNSNEWNGSLNWQNWTPSESMWYYNTTQGSDLLPYDIFMHLEQSDSKELFRADENIDKYRYIVQGHSLQNDDNLPLGFVKDTYRGKDYIGFSCAACHTNQIVYNDIAIRVDGAPAMADMDSFMKDIEKAITTTLNDDGKLNRMLAKVKDNYDSEKNLKEELEYVSANLFIYNKSNESNLSYGYGRLDAFGRIFNRVLQHLVSREVAIKILKDKLPKEVMKKVNDKIDKLENNSNEDDDSNIVSSRNFVIMYIAIDNILKENNESNESRKELFNKLFEAVFNSPNAPVSYPFLWDTPQHDYLQWNGIASNGGVGPLGRNTGEVLGVFGSLDWKKKTGISFLLSKIGGQTSKQSHISFESSVNFANIRLLESQLKKLQSPKWPEQVLPKINHTLADKGKILYDKRCLSCHAVIEHNNSKRRVIAQMDKVSDVGTDDKMAKNSITYQGRAGILEGDYIDVGVGKLYIEKSMPVATLLTSATANVILTPDPDKWFLHRWFDWTYNIYKSYKENNIETTLKKGSHEPATTVAPFADLLSYKGRPLNGIWATAPYLHNGSVPTLYDLLLPKECDKDKNITECRPDKFMVGSRTFDPIKVGFITEGYKGTLFDTSLYGNHNTGHEYAAGNTPIGANNKTMPPFTKQERLELIEYLKTL